MRAAAVAVRYCTRPSCGQRHHDPAFSWCLACRLLSRDWGAAYRADHARRGLCIVCVDAMARGHTRCEYHLEYLRQHNDKRYADQLAKGLCRWGRCPRRVRAGWYCAQHREQQREQMSAWRRKRRRGR